MAADRRKADTGGLRGPSHRRRGRSKRDKPDGFGRAATTHRAGLRIGPNQRRHPPRPPPQRLSRRHREGRHNRRPLGPSPDPGLERHAAAVSGSAPAVARRLRPTLPSVSAQQHQRAAHPLRGTGLPKPLPRLQTVSATLRKSLPLARAAPAQAATRNLHARLTRRKPDSRRNAFHR